MMDGIGDFGKALGLRGGWGRAGCSVFDWVWDQVGYEAAVGLGGQQAEEDGVGIGEVAAFPALVQVAVGGGEVSGLLGVLEEVLEETERVGREHLAGHEIGPEVAVIFGDAAGADDAEFADELALDGVDLGAELGEGHGWRSYFQFTWMYRMYRMGVLACWRRNRQKKPFSMPFSAILCRSS